MKTARIKYLLNSPDTPQPPEGLADTIKSQIPENVSDLLTDVPNTPKNPPRRQHFFAAAAIVTVVLTGAVTWQLRQGPVDRRVIVDEKPITNPTEEVHDTTVESVATVEIVETGAAVQATAVPEHKEELRKDSKKIATIEEPKRQVQVPDPSPADPEPINFAAEITVNAEVPVINTASMGSPVTFSLDVISKDGKGPARANNNILSNKALPEEIVAQLTRAVPASTGGTDEPNDQPYGDVFFDGYGVNPFIDTEDDHLSTFGLDVDTGSYTVTRRYIRDGNLPPREAIRVEEFVNYFDYGDRAPSEDDFDLTAEGAPTPFAENKRHKLLRFAINAREVDRDERPPAVLTFVIDVSGSMNRENRLGLVKESLYELLENLRSDDRVGLVIYGSRGQVILEPTDDHEAIRAAIGRVHAGGSTNAEEGLVLAYEQASAYLDREYINRVILCSDGVANVGRTGANSILERIRRDAERGIELTTVGFGMGNYNDTLMEQLADTGNGRYAYVDALPEARKLFVEELTGTLLTIGHDAKAQVDFNPAVVERYRLIGYENRDIADNRFRDPTVDAGEIGAGHSVTALYEVKLKKKTKRGATLATLRMRYRPMNTTEVIEIEKGLKVRELARSWEKASRSLRLAGLVAEYAEVLKGAYWAREGDLRKVLRLAQTLAPEFAGHTQVADFTSLVAAAAELKEPSKKISNGDQ